MKVLASKEGQYGIWHVYVPELDISATVFIEQDIVNQSLSLIEDLSGKTLTAEDLDVQQISYSEIYMYENGGKTWRNESKLES